MTNQQRGLILLIKSAITGEAYTLPTDFDIAGAFETADKHGITAIVYYGAYNCKIDASTDVMKNNLLKVYRQVMTCTKQDADIQQVLDTFENNGIKHLPLKGINLRKLYPKPEMRRMGDADILIDIEQYDSIRPLMINLGYSEKEEKDHELPWISKAGYIELHRRLVPSTSKDYYRYFKDCWRFAKLKEGKKYEYQMSLEDEFIFVFTHFAKHYRSAGIGIRHFIDLWVLKLKYTNLDIDYIRTELNKLGLLEFYDNIVKTIAACFENAPLDEKSDYITQVIFGSSEYGNISAFITSKALKEKKSGKSESSIKLNRITKALFPNYSMMCEIYPFLAKVPILLPLMWVVHFFRRFFEKNKLKKFLKAFRRYSHKNVSDHEKALLYVGLDYNFKE